MIGDIKIMTQIMMKKWCSSYKMIAMIISIDDDIVDDIKWYNLIGSSKALQLMIVNRRECIQIEAKQVLFLFKCSYKLVGNV